MAFMLEINEWIIVTKTNEKPFQNQFNNSNRMESSDKLLHSRFRER